VTQSGSVRKGAFGALFLWCCSPGSSCAVRWKDFSRTKSGLYGNDLQPDALRENILREHDGLCAFALTEGQRVQTDCSVHIVTRGQTYCFQRTRELSQFATNLDANIRRADEVFARM
jgi:hypothetical protein